MNIHRKIAEEEAQLKDLQEAGEDEKVVETTPPVTKKTAAKNAVDDLSVDDEDAGDAGEVVDDKKKTAAKAEKTEIDPKKPAAKGEEVKADDKDDKKDAKVDENPFAARARIAEKQRKEMQEKYDALVAKNAEPKPIAATKPAEGVDAPEVKAPTAEERVAKLEAADEERKLYNNAVTEFTNIEREFQKNTPDYAEASDHMITRMAEATRLAHPDMTDAQIGKFLQSQILTIASRAVQRGNNPAEVLYGMALEKYGFTGKKAAAVEEAPKPKTVDRNKQLTTVAKNKARSATGLTGGGQSNMPGATIEEAVEMNLADFSKLSASEIDALIADARG